MAASITTPESMSPLFTPWSIGDLQLKHRIVLAPLTRMRAEKESLDPIDLMVEYYAQRASDGGLLIAEVSASGFYMAESQYDWKMTDMLSIGHVPVQGGQRISRRSGNLHSRACHTVEKGHRCCSLQRRQDLHPALPRRSNQRGLDGCRSRVRQ